jgi:alpha-tubulin suppressor-like RCC1 family protein
MDAAIVAASDAATDAGNAGENGTVWFDGSQLQEEATAIGEAESGSGRTEDAAPGGSTNGDEDLPMDGGSEEPNAEPADEASVDAGPCVSAIAAGMWHMCALSSRGNVHCWGYDLHGELGDGTTTSTSRPTLSAIPALTGAKAVAGGGYFTCALTAGDGVRCWGDDRTGQLGVMLPDASTPLSSPPAMDILSNAQAIATGYDVACALTSATAGGGVRCWGNNASGQLGIGSASPAMVAVPPTADVLTGVKTIVAGLGRHVCALTTSGGLRCWGQNTHGQLGLGSSGTTPVFSPPNGDVLDNVTAVSVGFYHTCAAMADGGLRCWGSNDHGQLGDGTMADRAAPPTTTTVLAGTMVKAIAAGYTHTCALTVAGAVYCWGDDQYGELGDGQLTDALRSTPGPAVPIPARVTALVTQESANCALTVDGDVQCWGANYYGQLGDTTTATYGRATPASVVGLSALCP